LKVNRQWEEQMNSTKSFAIPKELVWTAYKKVRANQGTYGVDEESLAEFEVNLGSNLYKLWNRMSSGSYFPQPVRGVEIPKSDGKKRLLGIPTVTDRIAQAVAVLVLEPPVEVEFHEDSFGYRPGKSAHQALAKAKERCLHYQSCIDLDIKGFFDNLDHRLLMHAVRKHTDCRWVLLYIERWLTAPMQRTDGTIERRTKGTPQGRVISPLLANIFLHHVFDMWFTENYPKLAFERYADDILVHSRTVKESFYIAARIKERFKRCCLDLNADKTKVVYCRDGRRQGTHEHTSFDFLGYTFRARSCRARSGNLYVKFSPAASLKALKGIRRQIRWKRIHLWVGASLESLANELNPLIRGWIEYYGKFFRSVLQSTLQRIDDYLIRWAQGKFRRLQGHRLRAVDWLKAVRLRQPTLFAHWAAGFYWT
jgi:group II intron reverse transcriptase/maturase